jgi:uncharacterized protein
MSLRERFRNWLLRGTAPVPTTAPPERPAMKVNATAAAELKASGREPVNPWALPLRPPGAPAPIAMDSYGNVQSMFDWAVQGPLSEGLGFLGYPYLAELSQRPEYRRISTIYAEEATRKWIKISGDEERVGDIEDAMKQFNVQALFRELAEQDGFFGRSQLFIDMGDDYRSLELATPLTLRKEKVAKGRLKGFKVIEPLWSYPGLFEASNPLVPGFYRPVSWQIQSTNVHATRLLTVVGREMPDILKAAYAFGGLSLSQMAKPYVDNWLRTRQSVSDLLHSFSTMVLSTNIGAVLQGGGAESLLSRAALFTNARDNRGLMIVDKDSEELTNVSTPLGTLDKLQAQAQEQIASVTGIPLVVLLGVTPSGLNASSDGEIQTFYSTIKAYQERVFRGPIETIIKLLQLNMGVAIDPEITFEFVDLWEADEAEKAAVRASDAALGVAYVNAGVVSADEERERLANDENGLYYGMDLSAPAPELPDDQEQLDELEGAQDAWREDDHKRDDDGKFSSTGGGGSSGGGNDPPASKAKRDEPKAPAAAPAPKSAAHPRIAAILGEKGIENLRGLIANKNSSAREIADALAPIEAAMLKVTPTLADGEVPDAAFWKRRKYTTDPAKPAAASANAAKKHLINVAKAYADDGVGMKYEAKARILLGPPAAGKSTSAEEIARRGGYAIADSDDAKKVIPEFDGGVGASAVHEESGFLGAEALASMLREKANVILPLVGSSPGSIRKRIAALREAGYDVTVDVVDVSPDEAARRRAARTLSRGRHISSAYALSIGTGPQETYETLKREYPELGFGRIDGNGPPRSERYVEAVNHPDAKTGGSVFA